MSDTLEQDQGTQGDEPPINEEVERVARANGWKPREEYKGDPAKWTSADVFVARGLESPAVLAERNKVLADRLGRLERVHTDTVGKLEKQLQETSGTVLTMTEMMRKSEERAYVRARRELQDEMKKAVETGDTIAFDRLEKQREDLEKAKPIEPPPRTETRTAPPPPVSTGGAPGMDDPDVQRFYAENDWYRPGPTRDAAMGAFADGIYYSLLQTRPDLSVRQKLDHVTAEVRGRYPTHFTNSAGVGRPNGAAQDPDENGRQDDSPVVTPSSGTPAPRQNRGRYTFDTMPKESKDGFVKYKEQIDRLIEQKGGQIKPLTKEEWARDYWAQFQDDGNP